MKKIEVLEIEETDLVKSQHGWRLNSEAKAQFQIAEMAVFMGQIVKNRKGLTTSNIKRMLEEW
jgi:hypothetical protein